MNLHTVIAFSLSSLCLVAFLYFSFSQRHQFVGLNYIRRDAQLKH